MIMNKANTLVSSIMLLLLTACGGSGGGSSNTVGTGNNASIISEGSAESPQILNASGDSGSVALAESSYYVISGLIGGADYAISFDTVNGSILPAFYSDGVNSGYQSCFSYITTTESCIVRAGAGGSIYLTIHNGPISTGSTFQVSAALAVEAGEGTPTSPKLISSPASYSATLSEGNSTSTSDPGNSGYYQITGLTPGNSYYITLSGISNGADLYLYQDSFSAEACVSKSSGTTDEGCVLTARASSLLVRVRARDRGSFTLGHVDYGAATIPPAEGSPASAILLKPDSSASYYGSVDSSKSYYRFSGMMPGQPYSLGMSFLSDNADLYVYSDASYSNLICSSTNSDNASESCTIEADANEQVWVVVDGANALQLLGTAFYLSMARIPATQGTADSPHEINSNTDLPFRVTAGSNVKSYYKVTGLSPNTIYMVTQAHNTNFPSMTVYPTTGFGNYVYCQPNTAGYTNCDGLTNDLGELFITITGGTAYLNVKPLPTASEGSATAPVVKTLDSLTNSFTGEVVENIDNFYEITGLNPSTNYHILVSFAPDEDAAVMSVYNSFSGDLSTQTASCSSNWSHLNNGCTVTSDINGKLWLEVGGWSVNVGAHFTVEALPVPTAEGSRFAPIDLTGALPYRATVGSDINSHYMVTGLTANSQYLFSREARSAGDYFRIYDDSTFTTVLCWPDNTTDRDDHCVGTPSGNTVYLMLNNTGYLTSTGYSNLDVVPVPPAEGSGLSPLQVIGTSHSGSVNDGHSFYQVDVAPDTSYTVSLSNVSGDPDLYIYSDSLMNTPPVCSSIMGKNQAESCQATSDANGKLWIGVDGGFSKGGGRYLLEVN